MQVKSLVSHAVSELGLNRFAILYPDERYGSTFMNLFWDEVLSRQGVVTGVEAYDPKQTDFADPIKKIVGLYYEVPEDLKDPIDLIAETFVQPLPLKEAAELPPKKEEEEPEAIVDFEAVFIPDSPKKAGLIIPQLAFYDVNDVYLLGTNIWKSEELIEMARQYVQAAVIPVGFFSESAAPPVKHFVNLFEDTFNTKPGFIEAVAYDSAMILLDLTNRSEVRSRRGLKDALKNLQNYPGVTGPTSFTETGDVLKELSILRIRGGRFIELKKSP
jgi:ABC-type branched-subunit amino acid transport system substrate-binding protein